MYLFITGGAGVGKSVLLTCIYQSLQRWFTKKLQEDPANLKLLLTAFTGKAACNIRGTTIQSAMFIPINQPGYQFKPLSAEKLNTLRAKYRDVKVLMIDEISMVGNGLLNHINKRLQEIMGNDMKFGGISVIAFGDFFQLHPVCDGWIFRNLSKNYGPLAVNLWSSNLSVMELTEIMRQKDDLLFSQTLNRLREGKHTKEDITVIKSREIPPTTSNDSRINEGQSTFLFATNDLVDAFNDTAYNSLPTQKYSITACDSAIGDITSITAQQILSSASKLKINKTMGLPKTLKIANGLKVEVSLNVRVEDGLVNGAAGFIKYIEITPCSHVAKIWVKFDDSTVGQLTRRDSQTSYHNLIRKEWTPICKVQRHFQVFKNKSSLCLRKQFPLRPAVAKTIHRSQGDTLTKVVVHFKAKKLQCHMRYVALSRVTALSGLYLRNFDETKISVSADVAKEMNRLRSTSLQTSCVPQLTSTPNNFSVAFHNARSLHKSIAHLKSDNNLLKADIICICETRLSKKDQDSSKFLPSHKFYRFDSNISSTNRTPPYGSIMYVSSK